MTFSARRIFRNFSRSRPQEKIPEDFPSPGEKRTDGSDPAAHDLGDPVLGDPFQGAQDERLAVAQGKGVKTAADDRLGLPPGGDPVRPAAGGGRVVTALDPEGLFPEDPPFAYRLERRAQRLVHGDPEDPARHLPIEAEAAGLSQDLEKGVLGGLLRLLEISAAAPGEVENAVAVAEMELVEGGAVPLAGEVPEEGLVRRVHGSLSADWRLPGFAVYPYNP
jgi:hypothetical protein